MILKVLGVSDRDLLKKILCQAVKSRSMEDFETALKELLPN